MGSKTFGGLGETLTLYDAKTSKIVHSVLYGAKYLRMDVKF